MKLLVLGGTKFLGRQVVTDAIADGHDVTLFNRGITNPGLFPTATHLVGDRGRESAPDLAALETGEWDCVFDFSGFMPAEVRATAALLRDRVARYVYVSSIAVYQHTERPGETEDSVLRELPDGAPEVFTMDNYGPLKTRCEQVVTAAYGDRATLIRTGFVTGPLDDGVDFMSWAASMATDDVVPCKARPEQPIQVLDVRDFATFMLLVATKSLAGPINVLGPAEPLTFAGMLETCRRVAGSRAVVEWGGDRDGFVIQPDDLSRDGTFQINFDRALAAGFVPRPFEETARDTMRWAGIV